VVRVSVLTLVDWPEDRLPTCANLVCGQEIPNGGKYVIVPDTFIILCAACSKRKATPSASKAAPEIKPDVVLPPPKEIRPPAPRIRRPVVPCAWCDAPVTRRGGRNSKHRYCTRQHAIAARTEQLRKAKGDRTIPCPTCQKLFTPALHGKRGQQQYCSLACSGKRPSRLPDIVCLGCGQTFRPQRYVQIYCSDRCRYYGNRGKVNPDPPTSRFWSRKYDKCIDCGTSERRHMGNGQCSRCYCPPGLVPQDRGRPCPELEENL
jgi:hypothetical protein